MTPAGETSNRRGWREPPRSGTTRGSAAPGHLGQPPPSRRVARHTSSSTNLYSTGRGCPCLSATGSATHGHRVLCCLRIARGLALARLPGQARIIEARLRGGDAGKRCWRASAGSPWRNRVGQHQNVAEAVSGSTGHPATGTSRCARHRQLGVRKYPEGRLESLSSGTSERSVTSSERQPAPAPELSAANPRL